MKTRFLLIGMLAGLLGFAGCAKDDSTNGADDSKGIQLTVVASADDDLTKVSISGDKTSGFATAWEEGDKIAVFTDNASTDGSTTRSDRTYNYSLSIAAGAINDGVATFTGDLYKSTYAGVNDLYSYFPYKDAYNSLNIYSTSTTYADVKCGIPSAQTMTASGSYDPDAAYMVGQKNTVDLTSSNAVTTSAIKFRHIDCFINLSTKAISNADVLGTEVVKSVSISCANKTLAGDFTLNLSNGTTAFTTTSDNVTTTVASTMTLTDMSVWFVVNPFSLTAADELVVAITTKDHIITKTITSKAIEFAAKNVITLNLTIDSSCTVADAPAEPVYEWVAVTSANDVTEGTYVIASLYNNTYYHILNETATSAPAVNTGITVANSKITSVVSSAMTWDIAASDTKFVITSTATPTNYFGASGDASESVRVGSSYSDITWTFSDDTTYGLLAQPSKSTKRYLSMYVNGTTVQDWRTYGLGTNFKGSLTLFKRTLATTEPTIVPFNITNVAAAGVTGATKTVEVQNSTNAVSVKSYTGIVAAASVSGTTLNYTVAPNYTGAAAAGTIVLSLTGAADATVNVSQVADEFTVAPTELTLGAASGATQTINVTSTYAWDASVGSATGFTISPASGAAGTTAVTVTATADGGSEIANLGTVTITRDDEASTEKSVTIKQSAASALVQVNDVLTASLFAATGNAYTAFTNITATSTAKYAGNSAKDSAGGIQLNSKSKSGIVTTSTAGKVTKITVVWDSKTFSERTLDIYGKSTAYSAATDLYNASNQGTKIGSIVNGTSTELVITGDYEYIGMRSNSGAMYLTSITVTWN